MKTRLLRFISCVSILFVAAICSLLLHNNVFADSEFAVSPMKQKIVLLPGDTYYGTFDIVNPASNKYNFDYTLKVEPFFVDETNDVKFENNGDYNQITDWINLTSKSGTMEPNSTQTVYFTISVPENAPAGGQYASIIVTGSDELAGATDGLNIKSVVSISHLIMAEVAGTTNRSGEIFDVNIPGFIFDGNISASSLIKNYGNVHGTAKYTMQVYPLFSSEEVYTNEENPEEKTIMPERELFNTSYWDNTPAIGIFNVIYKVDFDGVTAAEVSKLVIKCPIWLLFVIIFAIAALIIWLVVKAKGHKSKK